MQEKSENQFSIEFFPPKTISGEAKLDGVFDKLSRLKPHFYSITYGANGSTKKGTQELTFRYQQMGANMVREPRGCVAPGGTFGPSGVWGGGQRMGLGSSGPPTQLLCI